MKNCVIFDLLRQRGHVTDEVCEEEATCSLPKDDEELPFCPKHYDLMLETMKRWKSGGDTERREKMAVAYFRRHPEVHL